MDLENEIRTIMRESPTALTVDQVRGKVADRIGEEIHSVLNNLKKRGELNYLPGGGGHQARYMFPAPASIERRF
jgi:hypothetical protein